MTTASLCGPTCGGQLYIHVVGATALFGGALVVTILGFAASRYPPEQTLFVRRLAFWLTLFIMVPAWILMRVGGQLILTNEHLDKSTPGWINAGFAVSDGGAVLILLLLLVTWLGWKRPRLAPLVGALGTLYIVALGVAWFAMSYKPGW